MDISTYIDVKGALGIRAYCRRVVGKNGNSVDHSGAAFTNM